MWILKQQVGAHDKRQVVQFDDSTVRITAQEVIFWQHRHPNHQTKHYVLVILTDNISVFVIAFYGNHNIFNIRPTALSSVIGRKLSVLYEGWMHNIHQTHTSWNCGLQHVPSLSGAAVI